ncbi:ABC transporter permease [Pollutibacter soli]|uniref:ABC transporter permease n=1 Tax=Pollutibacter soli TaxID=3034157 RepID=UPI003013289A
MIRNYLKVALRYLFRYKTYTAINITGLAVGIAACILIMLFVKSEFTYDKFHSKSDQVYRAWQHEKYEGQDFINTVTPLPMGAALQANYPEVENSCRVYAMNPVIKLNNNSFSEDVLMVDSGFFRMFDFKLVSGNRENPFPLNNTAILTEQLAKKYFGSSDAVGKTFEMQVGDEKTIFTVSGIAKPAPEESSIKYKMLIPYSNAKFIFRPGLFNSWFNVYNETYVQLKKGTQPAALEKKFPEMLKQVLGEDYKEGAFLIHLQPITDIHLNSSLPAGNEPISNPKYSYILGTIGILILLIACINFITLSIGRSATRAMEVGVRKVLGAEKKQLIRQFWGEAFLLTCISVAVGILLAALFIKPFNSLTNRNLSLSPDFSFVGFCFLLIGIVALIAGMYPSFILSSFRPVEVLKGKLKLNTNTNWLRQSLVTGQFVASIVMIVSAMIIGEQMSFLKNKNLGYDKEQLVVVQTHMQRGEGMQFGERFRNELLKHPEIKDAAVSMYSMAEPGWIGLGFTDDSKVYHNFQFNAVDAQWMQLMDIKVKEGRLFSKDNPSDVTSAAVVNEAFLKEFKIENPIGRKLPGKFEQQIIGVVKDFNFQSLHSTVAPLLLTILPDTVFRRTENISVQYSTQPRITIRMKPGNIAGNISIIEKTWKELAPNQDFDYAFLDDKIATLYATEKRTSDIVRVASLLSIFIACMGLFGLATLTVIQRTKEIGIRKVLGAKVSTLVALLAKDFIRLTCIAAVIASPLAWWFMKDWLKDFAYRVNIQWWVFVVAAIVVMLITLITVCMQAIRAALANPVKSLRTE